jgi:DMSO reductase family type II enzyme heme b subunit
MAQSLYNRTSLVVKGIIFAFLVVSFCVLFDYGNMLSASSAAGTAEDEQGGNGNECNGSECENKNNDTKEKSEENLTGKKRYIALCAPCHGHKGDGKGFARSFTWPKARDFTSGIFKYRSTRSGEPPTDEDLMKVTKKGNPGTAMPAYGNNLSDSETLLIIRYIKEELAPEVFQVKPSPYLIGDPPEATPDLIQQGRELYEKGDCIGCHGRYGRGDGEMGWQDDMKDAWGDRIYPTNLTHPWELRNFATEKDLFRSLITGLDGTPMASYDAVYTVDELWALAHYLKSIQINRTFKDPLTSRKVGTIPGSADDAVWNEAEFTDMLVQGKKSFGQALVARVTNIRLRAVHSGSEIAIMVEWSDKKPDKGGDGHPPDSVKITFPSVVVTTDPWVDKGDRRSTIDVWKWNAADDRAIEAFRRGNQESTKERTHVRVISSYRDGLYRTIFIREKNALTSGDINFNAGNNIFYGIRVNDGDNFEQGDRGGMTGHRKLILE